MSPRTSERTVLPELSWPQAFALVFGCLPLAFFATAVLVAYPDVVLLGLGIGCAAWWLERRSARRAALAERAAVEYPRASALVAEPLPDMPTIPMRRSA